MIIIIGQKSADQYAGKIQLDNEQMREELFRLREFRDTTHEIMKPEFLKSIYDQMEKRNKERSDRAFAAYRRVR